METLVDDYRPDSLVSVRMPAAVEAPRTKLARPCPRFMDHIVLTVNSNHVEIKGHDDSIKQKKANNVAYEAPKRSKTRHLLFLERYSQILYFFSVCSLRVFISQGVEDTHCCDGTPSSSSLE